MKEVDRVTSILMSSEIKSDMQRCREESNMPFEVTSLLHVRILLLALANAQSYGDRKCKLPSKTGLDDLVESEDGLLAERLTAAMSELGSLYPLLGNELSFEFSKYSPSELKQVLKVVAKYPIEQDVIRRVFNSYFDEMLRDEQFQYVSATEKSLAHLLQKLLAPEPGMRVYDPCCGHGAILASFWGMSETLDNGNAVGFELFGREVDPRILFLAKLRFSFSGRSDVKLELGDSLDGKDCGEERSGIEFDIGISDPPFALGKEPNSYPEVAFIEHLLENVADGGKIAALVSTDALMAYDLERFRKRLLELDWLDGVIKLPSGLLPRTRLSPNILLIDKNKPPERKGRVFFLGGIELESAHNTFSIPDDEINRVVAAYNELESHDRHVSVVKTDDLFRLKCNLNPSSIIRDSEIQALSAVYGNFTCERLGNLLLECKPAKSRSNYEGHENTLYIHSHSLKTELSPTIPHKMGSYRLVLKDEISADYLQRFFQSPYGLNALKSISLGSVSLTLQKRGLQECVVALPREETQKAIVQTHQKLDDLYGKLDLISEQLSLNPADLSPLNFQLDQTIKAFGLWTDTDEIRSLISKGENKKIEFKETLTWCVREKQKSSAVELSAIKTIAAFRNTDGGNLLIGVRDSGEITGTSVERKKAFKDSDDHFFKFLRSKIATQLGMSVLDDVDYSFVEIDGERVLKIEVQRQDLEPTWHNQKTFYQRHNPATQELVGPALDKALERYRRNI